MNKKKLIAILALVCFMFTLVPVAAMATEEIVVSDVSGLRNIATAVNSGDDYANKVVTLGANIDLNPGYTFSFDADTGMVAVKKNGDLAFYLGTAYEHRTVSDVGNAQTAGKFYVWNGTVYQEIESSNVVVDSIEGTVTVTVDSNQYVLNTWTPIGTDENAFSGEFNGNSYKISGLYLNNETAHQGLIGYNKGTVKNIIVENSYYYCGKESGGMAGYNTGTISDCQFDGVVCAYVGSGTRGGICGYNAGKVDGCIAKGLVSGDYDGSTGSNQIGGIVGVNIGSVLNCTNYAYAWSGAAHVGGIVGYNRTEIKDCKNYGTISTSYNQAGGISGHNNMNVEMLLYPTIQNCTNYGSIYILTEFKNGNNVGGIAGAFNSTDTGIVNCVNQGKVTAASYVGGIVGKLDGQSFVKESYNMGMITGGNYIGGIVGSMFADSTSGKFATGR